MSPAKTITFTSTNNLYSVDFEMRLVNSPSVHGYDKMLKEQSYQSEDTSSGGSLELNLFSLLGLLLIIRRKSLFLKCK